ncbi:MAG: hypothetical protein IAI50_13305 [Candidatus Eremiobacteraeota bacterium]|nr:hypothetical protein [Candidatus Eremiobacteraeota bacterium]
MFIERLECRPLEVGEEIERDDGRLLLALGEATGHAHAILEDDVSLFALPETDDRLLLVSASEARLLHEEYAPITLPMGNYVVRLQVEYSPGVILRVAD